MMIVVRNMELNMFNATKRAKEYINTLSIALGNKPPYIVQQTLCGFVRKLTTPKLERYESCCHHEYKSECPFCDSNIKNSPF